MKINTNESFRNSLLIPSTSLSTSSSSSASSSSGQNDSLNKSRMKSPSSSYSMSSSSTSSSSSARLRTSMLLQTAYMGCHYESLRQDENWMRFRKKIDDEQTDVCIKWINLQFSRLLYDANGVISNEAKDSYSWLMVTDLAKDFSDGIRLIYLIQIIYNVSLNKEMGSKTFGCLKLHKVKNHETCLNYLQNVAKLKCVGINPLDLVEGNKKMIISLLFLIRHDFETKLFKQENSIQMNFKLEKLRNPRDKSLVNETNRINLSKSQLQINTNRPNKPVASDKKAKYLSSAQYPSVSYLIDELNLRASSEKENFVSKSSLSTRSKDSSATNSSVFNQIASNSKLDQLYTLHVKSNHSINSCLIKNDTIIDKIKTADLDDNLNYHQVNEIKHETLTDISSECNSKTLFYPEILEIKHNYAAELDQDLTDSGYSNNMILNFEEKRSKSNSLESIDSKNQDNQCRDIDVLAIDQNEDDYSQSDDDYPENNIVELINVINSEMNAIDISDYLNNDLDNENLLTEPMYEKIDNIVNNNFQDLSHLTNNLEFNDDTLEIHRLEPFNLMIVEIETTHCIDHSTNESIIQLEQSIENNPVIEVVKESNENYALDLNDSFLLPDIDIKEVNETISYILNEIERNESLFNEELNQVEFNDHLLENSILRNETINVIEQINGTDNDNEINDDFDEDDDENTETVICNSSFIDPDEIDDYKFENIEFEEKIRDLDELLENQLQHELDKIIKDEQLLEILNENLINEKDNLKEIEEILSKQADDSTSQVNCFIDKLILDYDDIKPTGFNTCLLEVIEHEKVNATNLSQEMSIEIQEDLTINEEVSLINEISLNEPIHEQFEIQIEEIASYEIPSDLIVTENEKNDIINNDEQKIEYPIDQMIECNNNLIIESSSNNEISLALTEYNNNYENKDNDDKGIEYIESTQDNLETISQNSLKETDITVIDSFQNKVIPELEMNKVALNLIDENEIIPVRAEIIIIEKIENQTNNNDDDGIQLEDEELDIEPHFTIRSRSHSNSSNSSRSTLSSSSNNNIIKSNSFNTNLKEEQTQPAIIENEFQETLNKSSYAFALMNGQAQINIETNSSNNNNLELNLKHDENLKKTHRVKLNIIPVEMKEKSLNGKIKHLNEPIVASAQRQSVLKTTNEIENRKNLKKEKKLLNLIPIEETPILTVKNKTIKDKNTKPLTNMDKDLSKVKSKSKKENSLQNIVEKPKCTSSKRDNNKISLKQQNLKSRQEIISNHSSRYYIVKYFLIAVFILAISVVFSLLLTNESVFNLYDFFDLMSKLIN